LTRVLPHLVRHYPRSEELVCLHEAGHVERILTAGGMPEFVEIYDDPEPFGRSRAPVFVGRTRQEVAVAGFAVELSLFKESRLIDAAGVPVTMKQFIQGAVAEHAAEDKVRFFGENRERIDGCWPPEDDLMFMQAGECLRTRLNMAFVEDFATELLNRRRLEVPEIQAIARRHGLLSPHVRPHKQP